MGYRVHASDGDIGKVDEASNAVDESSIVVDTGPWIFGRKVILPAGTIQRVDDADEKVYVDLTKAQIKDSPELDDATADDPAYRDRLGTYYGEFYRSPRRCPAPLPASLPIHPSIHPPIHPSTGSAHSNSGESALDVLASACHVEADCDR
ncbi:PRC-barrel domain-containing protein [Pseudarthrobacter sp. NamB4]|uniref:PRC-barrel domain-containing protein n=1 Tax=Pseudarthrobacter sp. NamB4 TaxID=2576837 RepID=UPI001F0DF22F|nr:PRC-barrel domain-containing protein [Pseudarthrobacter sp. NamB4]